MTDKRLQLSRQMEQMQQDIQSLQEQIKELQASNPLWGKKYVACGDSMTQGDFNHWQDEAGRTKQESPVIYDAQWQMYKTYPWWIAKRNHMTLINEALCGSTIALPKEYLAGTQTIEYRHPFSHERYKLIPEDTDYCTIWFGGNDSARTNLGSIDDTTNETFYGAWNVVLEWLLENRPKMKLGLLVTYSGKPEFREAVRQCARKWGVPYLDMKGDPQVPVIFGREKYLVLGQRAEELRRAQFKVAENNGHPNVLAHELQSYCIEDFLRRL